MDNLINKIQEAGGTAMLVGGAVIDQLQGNPIKDYDIEVYGLTMSELEKVVRASNYPCKEVGKSFGIIKTYLKDDNDSHIDIDLSIPRRENKVGVGHTDFEVQLDPDMSPLEAARRRDLTINSMYINLHTNELIDPYNGLTDLSNGCLRATNPDTFIEDPLRVLRIMQLLPRKGKYVDCRTTQLCDSLCHTFNTIAPERVFEEFNKLLLKADKPSKGLQFLFDCCWIRHFPELNNLIGCPQHPEWHPEGDVWTHTLMVLDNAAALRQYIPDDWKLAYMYGALLHDIGKPATTNHTTFTAYGHDKVGEELARQFMKRITNEVTLINRVCRLVGLHMQAGQLTRGNAKIPAWKRLHNKCRLDILGWLSKADSAGRTGRSINDPHQSSENCFMYCDKFGAEPIPKLVQGRDLIQKGYAPGKAFTPILALAYELQLEGWSKDDILAVIKQV